MNGNTLLGRAKNQLDFLRGPIACWVGGKFASLQADSPLRSKHDSIELLFYEPLRRRAGGDQFRDRDASSDSDVEGLQVRTSACCDVHGMVSRLANCRRHATFLSPYHQQYAHLAGSAA